ncbi:L-lactate permease [Thorsellia anophelis]|uniref:L-lactate permease n=1 Tax=Thorsellia anophelis DSM 18579 TaxID=1123402 RepID=A0A1I0CL60_9GAMM|nr:L-lactate permease [Thorsellia anophelis]SET20414.1 lactate permease [Thorsellia anophelis DSM 18579]
MTTPVTLITWSAAVLPIILLLFLLIVRKWAVVDAAIIGVVTSIVSALYVFQSPLSTIGYEITKGVWNSISIIAVIIPAIFLYELSFRTNAYQAIQNALTQLIPDKLLQVLAIGWCFASFLQGPSGFGVPIAVTAPILIGIGVRPLWAVLIPLVGHAWAGTFGTLALGWQALVQQTFLSYDIGAYKEAALWTSLFTGFTAAIAGFVIAYVYGGFRAIVHGLPAIVLIGGVISTGQLITSQYFTALSAVLPTTLALALIFFIARLPRYKNTNITSKILDSSVVQNREISTKLSFHEALLPYYVLVGLSAVVLVFTPLNTFLGQFKMSLSFPSTTTGYGYINPAVEEYGSITWLTHSGFFLLISALMAFSYYFIKGHLSVISILNMLKATIDKSVPPALSIMLLLIMSKVMNGSNQVGVLAMGVAAVTGGYYAFFSPFVGTIGAFMSSSNVSSNILLAQFQESMAEITGNNKAIFLAAQTSGGAIGTMISPSNLLLGVTTAGIAGKEGEIIKKLLPLIISLLIIIGIITAIMA